MAFYLSPNTLLPWSSSVEDDERFKRILKIALIALVVLSIPITLIDVPEQTREEKAKLPPQLARVILEKQELPPPKPVEPPKVEEKKPEEPKPEEPKPEPEKKPEPVKEKPPEKPNVAKAREKAAASGLLQFKDDLMEMRESLDVSAIGSANVARGEATAATVDRSMVTSGVTTASGGINTAALSRDTGGVALSGRETTKVESDLAKSTGTTAADSGGQAQESAARSEEEIRKVMEQHKGAIFSIYNRALRQNPALQGKVVVKIIIESSGKISDVSIVSSELQDPDLEAKLLQRIRLISFPASNVARTTLNYSFDFLPQ
ncbi:TonB family protein [Cellvibrio sp. ARAG 10.3]|uniref:AgmX/PglI C-terminal domain-containing protein n=1 Tax=Cellvibrio sp. ARAG 10.3 TaxID=3451358 RepID=UPI003F4469DA